MVREAQGEGDIFGRVGLCDQIGGFLEGDTAVVCVLSGERGSGKSVAWDWLVGQARVSDFWVLTSRASSAETDLPYGGLSDLMQGLGGVLDELTGAQRGVVDRLLLRAERYQAAAIEERDLCLATLTAIRQAADSQRVLVAVDDWQSIDAPSRRVLTWVMRRLDPATVRMFATAETGWEDLLSPALGSARVQRVCLAPLSAGTMRKILHCRFAADVDRVTMERIVQVASGNPWVAVELARAIVSTGEGRAWSSARPLPVPLPVRDEFAPQLTGLALPGRWALITAFALGAAPEDVLRRSLDRLGWAQDGVEQLRDAGLLVGGDALMLSRPLLGAMLYGDCRPGERRKLHSVLAEECLEREGRVWHTALASRRSDGAIADALEQTATELRARGEMVQAAAFSEVAWQMTPCQDQERTDQRLLALSLDNYVSGDAQRARSQWREVAASSGSRSSAATALTHLAAFHAGFTVDENEEILRGALERGEEDRAVRAHIQTTRAVMASWGGRPVEAETLAEEAVGLARSAGEQAIEGEAVAALVEASFLLGRGVRRDLLNRAIELERERPEAPVEVRPSFLDALLEVWMSDRLELAEQRLESALELTVKIGDEASPALILVGLTEVASWMGAPRRAGEYAKQAAAHQHRGAAWHLQGMVRYASALVDITSGDIDRGRLGAIAALEFDEPRGVLLQYGRSRSVLGQLELSLNDPEAALGWLEPLHAALTSGGYGEPALFRYLPDLIESRAALGDLEGAGAVLLTLQEHAVRSARPWAVAVAARSAGMLNLAAGASEEAVAQLQTAGVLLEQLGQPGEQARCLLALGSAQRRLRRKREADETLAAAQVAFERLGMRVWAERASVERRRTNLRPRAAATLTDTERQIAQLAATGLSNREIAARVFLSVKTVEANLTRIYGKLGVRSRAALAHHPSAVEGHP